MDIFKNACRLHTAFTMGTYLKSNSYGRWDGALKAVCHIELCQFYVAVVRGLSDPQKVQVSSEDFKSVRAATQKLTDNLDEMIGFPLESEPDYDSLVPLFFEHFHTLAMGALQ